MYAVAFKIETYDLNTQRKIVGYKEFKFSEPPKQIQNIGSLEHNCNFWPKKSHCIISAVYGPGQCNIYLFI